MTSRAKIFITFIFIIVITGLVITLAVLLMSQASSTNENPVSFPTSYNTNTENNQENIIKITPENAQKYKYAEITNRDTLSLKTEQGEALIINLDHKKWKNIQWNEDGLLVAVLGESKAGIFDIYTYNLLTQSWQRATNFEAFGSGVESFVWKNTDLIYFTQGKTPDKWLYSYSYTSKTQSLKIKKVDADIQSLSPSKDKILLSKTESNKATFTIINTDGDKLYNFNAIKDSSEKILNVTNVMFTPDVFKLLLTVQDSDGQYIYKHEFGSTQASILSQSKDLTPVCSTNENTVFSYYVVDNQIKTYTLNVKDNTNKLITSLTTKDPGSVNLSKSQCFDTSLMIMAFDQTDKTTWYLLKDNKLEDSFILKDDVQVDIK